MLNFQLGIIFGWRGFDDFVFYLRFHLHVLWWTCISVTNRKRVKENKVRPSKMAKRCGENGTSMLHWDSVDWYSSCGEKKITLISKCSNELYALQFQIPASGNFSFVLGVPSTRNQELWAMRMFISSVISANECYIKARCPTIGE